jgi:hypothetical protein
MAFDPLDPYDVDDNGNVKPDPAVASKIKQAEEDFLFVMNDPRGRRFLWRLLERTGVYRTTFRPNSEMAFLEGVRSVGVTIVADMHRLAFQQTINMMQEQTKNG